MNGEEIISALRSNRGLLEFLKEFSEEVPVVYSRIERILQRKFKAPEAQGLRPGLRRAAIDSTINKLGQDFKGVEIRAELNKAGNSWHREVRSDIFVLTASFVNSPKEIVREAEFRKTLATDPQGSLFLDEEMPVESSHCYGIILHGKNFEVDDSIPFLRLAIPSPSCESYVLNLDLYEFLEITPSKFVPKAKVEEIPDEARPQIKKGVVASHQKEKG